MTTKKLEIAVPHVSTRTWTTLDQMPFSTEELMAIVHRYCDAQDHAKSYRLRRAERVKAALAFMEANGEDGDQGE